MADKEDIRESGLKTEIESCAFINFLEAVSSGIGWGNSRRDAVAINQAFELTTAKHKGLSYLIRDKILILENDFRSRMKPFLKEVLEISKITHF